MFLKGSLDPGNERTFDSCLHIAPMMFILRVPRPLLRKTDRARECHFPVNDENAPV